MWLSIRPGITRRPLKIDDRRVSGPASGADLALFADGGELAVADQGGVGARIAPVQGRELAVDEQQIGHGTSFSESGT
jgi:hypothetical protein